MAYLAFDNQIVNLKHVALIEYDGEGLMVHFFLASAASSSDEEYVEDETLKILTSFNANNVKDYNEFQSRLVSALGNTGNTKLFAHTRQ